MLHRANSPAPDPSVRCLVRRCCLHDAVIDWIFQAPGGAEVRRVAAKDALRLAASTMEQHPLRDLCRVAIPCARNMRKVLLDVPLATSPAVEERGNVKRTNRMVGRLVGRGIFDRPAATDFVAENGRARAGRAHSLERRSYVPSGKQVYTCTDHPERSHSSLPTPLRYSIRELPSSCTSF
jgi:hypothetical protein